MIRPVARMPDCLATRFSIAREMAGRGNQPGALTELQDLLPYLHWRLGPEHPDTLAAAEWIERFRRGAS